MKTINIKTPFITLGQLIKYSGLVQSGGDAKIFLEENKITHNGALENRRGKKIYPGDLVEIENKIILKVVNKE
ncbi:MAG TPA: S4 domain-containing protein YaaA [Bacillota bacterium]|nr:S4 domain-containing protein YaaA [Bacillota bacterium]HPF42090.1 S4 domain-containing protein YaaA [Bacillota bacterium]HPJ85812.1 S4 domain-containing protein YaaA [Bacillota bacterium]HPQ61537.1 S4 domain-containing protein YaaA [Bacillota bacterium]HRX91348.1 S4 domain-containing protein YaaA [Candidatus Izemoplasmatales bacterium]